MKLRDYLSWKRAFIFLAISLFLLFILVSPPVSRYINSKLEVQPNIQKADAIIMLTAGYYSRHNLSETTYQRMFLASQLYKKGLGKKIIVCGGTWGGVDISISEAVKEHLIVIGVKAEDIIVEKASKNTFENLVNAQAIASKHKFKSSLLVTSNYHMYRSLLVADKIGLNVFAAPVERCDVKSVSLFGWVFHISVNTRSWRETMSLVYFKLRGWA